MFTDLVIAISKIRKKEIKITFSSKIQKKFNKIKITISYYYENLTP